MSDTQKTALQEITHYPNGAFSWAALDAVDVPAAKQFFTALFGWTYEDVPMGEGEFYTIASLAGKPVAGMSAMRADLRATGAPSYWWLNINVDDVDSVAAELAPAGGTDITGPMDVFDQGRMVMLNDPTGALIGLWQARSFEGSGWAGGPGVAGWFELYTRNVPAAVDFYQKILGWRCDMIDFQGSPAAACHNNGAPVAMIMPQWEEVGLTRNAWVVYFGVEDVPAACARIQELGGSVLYGPAEFGGYPFAHVSDPHGGTFLIAAPPAAA